MRRAFPAPKLGAFLGKFKLEYKPIVLTYLMFTDIIRRSYTNKEARMPGIKFEGPADTGKNLHTASG